MSTDTYSGPSSFEPSPTTSANGHESGMRTRLTSAVDSGRESAVSGLRRTASAIRDTDALRSTPLGTMASNAASKLDAAAQYIEGYDYERMLGQAKSVITKNPAASLAAAAALGFLVAAVLKRHD